MLLLRLGRDVVRRLPPASESGVSTGAWRSRERGRGGRTRPACARCRRCPLRALLRLQAACATPPGRGGSEPPPPRSSASRSWRRLRVRSAALVRAGRGRVSAGRREGDGPSIALRRLTSWASMSKVWASRFLRARSSSSRCCWRRASSSSSWRRFSAAAVAPPPFAASLETSWLRRCLTGT